MGIQLCSSWVAEENRVSLYKGRTTAYWSTSPTTVPYRYVSKLGCLPHDYQIWITLLRCIKYGRTGPQWAGKMCSQEPHEVQQVKCKVLHPKWNNPIQQCRLGTTWLASWVAKKLWVPGGQVKEKSVVWPQSQTHTLPCSKEHGGKQSFPSIPYLWDHTWSPVPSFGLPSTRKMLTYWNKSCLQRVTKNDVEACSTCYRRRGSESWDSSAWRGKTERRCYRCLQLPNGKGYRKDVNTQ